MTYLINRCGKAFSIVLLATTLVIGNVYSTESTEVEVIEKSAVEGDENTSEIKAVSADNNATTTVYEVDASYQLNPGDTLDVSVWGESSLERSVTVLPDGAISFPLAGRIHAAGVTTTDLGSLMTKKLSKYLTDPVVTVTVTSAAGNTIFIIGEVNRPGIITMHQTLNVAQALAVAGGLTPFADDDEIKVIRMQSGSDSILKVHYTDIKKGKDMSTNHRLASGDVIVVP